MQSRKNLTRYTYDTTAFQGWRLNLSKRGINAPATFFTGLRAIFLLMFISTLDHSPSNLTIILKI